MTYTFSVNNLITGSGVSGLGGDIVVYTFKEFMKTGGGAGPGWTVTSSGDGLSAYSSSSDVITGSGTGANNIGNTSSWFVLQSPDRRQFLFFRGSANSLWVILYSKGGLFTGGTASTRPTATDAGIVLGQSGNSDPTTTTPQTWFNTATAYFHFGADDANGYSFYITSYAQTTGTTNTGGIFYDEVTVLDPTIDDDPRIIYIACGNSTNEWASQSVGAEGQLQAGARVCAWLYSGTSAEVFTSTPAARMYTGTNAQVIPGNISTNLYTLKDLAFPMFFCHRNGPFYGNTYDVVGFKGVSTYFLWVGNNLATPDTMSISSTRDHIVVGSCVLPFDGSVPSI
jgi:hypothetical protein